MGIRFSHDPHYVLRQTPSGVHRWMVAIKRQEGKAPPHSDFLKIQDSLSAITPDSLSDPQMMGRGSSGLVWTARHPQLGEVVFKWGGAPVLVPPDAPNLGSTILDTVNMLYGVDLGEWASIVPRVIYHLGGAALPTGYTIWSGEEIRDHLPDILESFAKTAIRSAKMYGEPVPRRVSELFVPISITPRAHIYPSPKPGPDEIDHHGAARLITLETLLGAPDRHPQNRLWVAGEDGKAHLVGFDYGWVGGTGLPIPTMPFNGYYLPNIPEDHLQEAVKEALNFLQARFSKEPRAMEGVLEGIRRIEKHLPAIPNRLPGLPGALQDNLEVFYNAFQKVDHPLKRMALS